MKKILSILLALTMCLSLLPLGALASEEPAEPEAPAGAEEPAGEETAAEETAEPVEEAEEPAAVAEAPVGETEEPAGAAVEAVAGEPEESVEEPAGEPEEDPGAAEPKPESAEPAVTEEEITMTVTAGAENLPDSDELFEQYVEAVMYASEPASYAALDYASQVFTSAELPLYEYVKGEITKIAEGKISSTEITIPDSYTAALPGMSGTGEAVTAYALGLTNKVLNALITECPAEMYWYNKTEGMRSGVTTRTEGDKISRSITLRFSVSSSYAAGEYATDAASIQKALEAIENARSVAAQIKAAYGTDYARMAAARDIICQLAEYNYDAASAGDADYSDPWQLIWVFDNDSATNVVCEGYSKAFQYLCDLTLDDAVCYCVTGTMNDGRSNGPHMWNVVRCEGANYLVDVTNCDSLGPDKLFLVGADAGSMTAGYTVAGISYAYDAECFDTYGYNESVLGLSAERYIPNRCGANTTWTLDENGVLTISGTGAMADYNEKTAPWYDQRASVTAVVIESGVTAIGKKAFAGCDGITAITFMEDMPAIGDGAFEGITAAACYYTDTAGWTEAAMAALGGSITWQPMGSKYLTDEAKTVTIAQTKAGAWDEGVKLTVTDRTENFMTEESQKALGIEAYTVYDIALTKNGEAVTSGSYAVTLALPEGYDADRCALFLAQDETLTDVETVCENGVMRFTTGSLGTYVLAEMKNTLLGDVNGDGTVNAKDVTVLFQYVNKQTDTMPNEAAADVNGDGKTDAKDVTRLFQYANKQIAEL